jgi:hypothetical protein
MVTSYGGRHSTILWLGLSLLTSLRLHMVSFTCASLVRPRLPKWAGVECFPSSHWRIEGVGIELFPFSTLCWEFFLFTCYKTIFLCLTGHNYSNSFLINSTSGVSCSSTSVCHLLQVSLPCVLVSPLLNYFGSYPRHYEYDILDTLDFAIFLWIMLIILIKWQTSLYSK